MNEEPKAGEELGACQFVPNGEVLDVPLELAKEFVELSSLIAFAPPENILPLRVDSAEVVDSILEALLLTVPSDSVGFPKAKLQQQERESEASKPN